MVLSFTLLSEITKGWPLYLGLVFILMVMFAPGGIASLVMMNVRVAAYRKLGRVATWYPALALTALVMFVGAAALIELFYQLQLGAGSETKVSVAGVAMDTHSTASWLGALAVTLVGYALFDFTRRRFGSGLGSGADRDRGRERGPGGPMSARYAVELKALRKSFGNTEIIRGTDLAVAEGERVAIIGPNGAGKSTLFNLISGRFGADERRDPAQRQAHRRPCAVRDQPPRPGAQLPDHQHLRRAVGVREPALRRPLVARLPLRVLEVPRRPAATPTSAPRSCCA